MIIIVIPAFLIPFFTWGKSSDPALFLKQCVLALFIFLAWTGIFVLNLKGGKKPLVFLPIRPIVVIYLLFLIITGASVFWALNPWEALSEWSKILLGFGAFGIFTTVFRVEEGFYKWMSRFWMLFTIIVSVWGLFQLAYMYLGGEYSHEDSYEIILTFAHRNLYAHVLALSLPICLFVYLSDVRIWKNLALVPLACGATLLLFLMVRTTWLATSISGLVLLPLLWLVYRKAKGEWKKQFGRRLKVLLLVLLLGGGGAFLLMFSGNPVLKDLNKQGESLTQLSFGSAQERLILWEKSWELYQQKPVLGHGLGNWKIVFPERGTDNLRPEMARAEGFFVRAHNDFLQLLVETGPAGALSFLLLLLLPCLLTIRYVMRSSGSRKALLMACLGSGFVAFAIVAVFSFPMERMTHIIFLNLMLASVVAVLYPAKLAKPETNNSGQNIKAFAFPLVMLFPLYISWQSLDTDIHLSRAMAARTNADWKTVIKEIEAGKSPFRTLDPSSTPFSWYSGMAYFSLGQSEKALAEFREAYIAHPHHPQVLNNLATCLVQDGQLEAAMAHYREARRIAPDFREPYINLIIVSIQHGDFEDAFQMLFAEEFMRSHPQHSLMLSAILDGKIGELIAEMEEDVVSAALRNIRRYKPWVRKMYENAQQKGHRFEEQVLIDTIYFLLKIKKTINLEEAGVLREHYQILN